MSSLPEAPTYGAVMRPAPSLAELAGTGLGGYLSWLAAKGRPFSSYEELWTWSVTDVDAFWTSIWDYFQVRGVRGGTALPDKRMPGTQWFPGSRVNYAEQIVGAVENPDRVAVRARSNTRATFELTYGELADQVRRARAVLASLGVQQGDRVVGYLPNIPETVVAMLATASLGAVWACCPPEFGARSVIDRLDQLQPKILLAVSGYTYGDKAVDRSAEVAAIRSALPSVDHVIAVPYGPHAAVADGVEWHSTLAGQDLAAPLEFAPVPFDHPLWTLFSSGTTGLPKAMVHSHGGITLEHLKLHALHLDTRPEDAVMALTTTGWTVWNAMLSSLMLGATLVITDGNPLHPDLLEPWRTAAEEKVSLLGISPAFIMACRKEGLEPARSLDLSSLRTLSITGSVLPPEAYDWLYDSLSSDVLANSMSGGTDICSNFVSGNPWLPVYRGEISGPALGADVAALDSAGKVVVGEVGELVVRAPMPSMPVEFWNDPHMARYRSSYFDEYPGIWRHGDWVTVTDRGSCIIHGRSDATLNRGGVRLGTGEFYGIVEGFGAIRDSLVVHLEDSSGGPGRLMLFVEPAEGHELDDTLVAAVKEALRTELSPRHVPDLVAAVPAIPRTLTGKKLETPLKKILSGTSPEEVVSRGAITGYDAIDAFVRAAGHATAG